MNRKEIIRISTLMKVWTRINTGGTFGIYELWLDKRNPCIEENFLTANSHGEILLTGKGHKAVNKFIEANKSTKSQKLRLIANN